MTKKTNTMSQTNSINHKKLFIFLSLWPITLFALLPTEELTPTEASVNKPTFSEQKQNKISQLEEKEKSLNGIFFNPEERKKLDAKKNILYKNLKFTQFIKNNAISFSEKKNISATTNTPKDKIEKNDIYFKGIVQRSDGKKFIWVNQEKTHAFKSKTYKTNRSHKKESEETLTLEDSISKKISNGVYQVELKPGQVWLKNSEKVSEGYLLFDASTLK